MHRELNREKAQQKAKLPVSPQTGGNAGGERIRKRSGFRRSFCRSLHHFIQKLLEIFQAWSRNDDCIAPATDIFRYAQEAAAWIFLQREDEHFPFNLDTISLQSLFVYGRLW